MSKRPKRKAYILIEVLVATSLFIMLLIAVFGTFWRTNKTNASINRLRVANEQMLITQATLQSLFSKISFKESVGPYFYQELDKNSNLPSLIFTVENIFQTSASITSNLLIKLYVEDNQLVVATFPHLKNQEGLPTIMQKEALLPDITDFKAEFFLAPESQENKKVKALEDDENQPKKPPTGTWKDNWPIEYDRLPTLLKLDITHAKSGSFTLWFFIPFSFDAIVYDKRQ